MKRIKLFEEWNVTNEIFLRTEKAKMEAWIETVLSKVQDSNLVKEIKRYAAIHEIDPYESFESFIRHVKDTFGNKIDFSGIAESMDESLIGLHQTIADKMADSLDKNKTYSLEEISKEIPKSGGVAAMHSDDNKIVAAKLKAMGFKIEGLDEALNDDRKPKFTYMMLSRLQQDNEYFLGHGNRSAKHLWAGNVDAQIKEMKRLWNSLPNDGKPEWLSMEEIEDYEKKMKNPGLKEAKTDVIEKGDEVIEAPDSEGFGYKGQTGTVVNKNTHGGSWTSYLVKFGKDEQEYHDGEIVKSIKK
jgi:hypothetical protein